MNMSRVERRTPTRLVFIVFIMWVLFPTSAIISAGLAHEGQGIPPSTSLGISPVRSGLTSINESARIAVVKPIFSATAYNNAFYIFYRIYSSWDQSCVTSNLDYLNVTVKDGWGWSYGLGDFLESVEAQEAGLVLGENLALIDEINVTAGGLFRNGERVYDVLILGFTEYVTQEEYYAYKQFVASGGTLIIMDGCNFLAEVKYYPPAGNNQNGYLSLVKGHGWEFNGTHAWKSVQDRWPEENINWVGSNFWHYWRGYHYDCFIVNTSHPISAALREKFGESIPSSYGSHEENLLRNFTNTRIIGFWHFIYSSEYPGAPIAAYEHGYCKGSVIHIGIMSSDVLQNEAFVQVFLLNAVEYALTGGVRGGPIPGADNGTPLIIASAIGSSAVIACVLAALDRRLRKKLESKR